MRQQYVVSSIQMKQLDFETMEKRNMSSLGLMKHAGKCMEEFIIRESLINKDDKILIVSGIGNNGGDALVIGSQLLNKGFKVKVVLVGNQKYQSEESRVIWDQLMEQDIEFKIVDSIEKLEKAITFFVDANIIIDGIFGIGLKREVEGYYKGIISMINQSEARVISIDIPSGINADNGLSYGISVKANDNLIVQHYKQGNLLNDAHDFSGNLHIIDVGIVSPSNDKQYFLNNNFIHKFEPRKHNTHKYHYGNIFVFGGSKGMMGAPLLAAYAALRTGSGLAKVLYHEKYLEHIQNPYPTIMVDTYKDILEQDLSKVSAIVFGPGLGRDYSYNLEVLKYLIQLKIPMIIDADGIYYLMQIVDDVELHTNIIITPHYGEMAVFYNTITATIQKDPTAYAKEVSRRYGITVVLKGSTTIITDGTETYFSNHGNPGMATAGSGDVLCGIIASILGRNRNTLQASIQGVYIHGNAAMIGVMYMGEESLIATDIIDCLPEVIK